MRAAIPTSLHIVRLLFPLTQVGGFSVRSLLTRNSRCGRIVSPSSPYQHHRSFSSSITSHSAHSVDSCTEWAAEILQLEQQQSQRNVKSWLVCGDGDLSYSALIAPLLAEHNIQLVATVLESQEDHNQIYHSSRDNVQIIKAANQEVKFKVDATKLRDVFPDPDTTFDRIQFNFPHWRGKLNHRYNRELVQQFLQSACQMLSTDNSNNSQIWIAFCDSQGGSEALDIQQWRQSWLAASYAADEGLLLQNSRPFREPQYQRSSHRGVDRAFFVGDCPMLYQFQMPNIIIGDGVEDTRDVSDADKAAITSAPKHLQLCCRHELHIVLPPLDSASPPPPTLGDIVFSRDNLMECQFIEDYIQSKIVPPGIQVDVPIRSIVVLDEGTEVAVYLIVYRGQEIPLTRVLADSCRDKLEADLDQLVYLRQERKGLLVSRLFPYAVLESLLDNVERQFDRVSNFVKKQKTES